MRTEEQVRKRLGDKGFVSEEADYVIAFLKEFGYIDDFEYAVSYIEYAAGKGHGARRIKDEMRRRGIDRNTIEDAFYEHGKIERQSLEAKWRAKRKERLRKLCA